MTTEMDRQRDAVMRAVLGAKVRLEARSRDQAIGIKFRDAESVCALWGIRYAQPAMLGGMPITFDRSLRRNEFVIFTRISTWHDSVPVAPNDNDVIQ